MGQGRGGVLNRFKKWADKHGLMPSMHHLLFFQIDSKQCGRGCLFMLTPDVQEHLVFWDNHRPSLHGFQCRMACRCGTLHFLK